MIWVILGPTSIIGLGGIAYLFISFALGCDDKLDPDAPLCGEGTVQDFDPNSLKDKE